MTEQVTMNLLFNTSINRDQQKMFASLFSETLVCFYHQHSLKFPTLWHNLVSGTLGIATSCKTSFWTTMQTASNWKYLKWNYHAPRYLWKNQEIKPFKIKDSPFLVIFLIAGTGWDIPSKVFVTLCNSYHVNLALWWKTRRV